MLPRALKKIVLISLFYDSNFPFYPFLFYLKQILLHFYHVPIINFKNEKSREAYSKSCSMQYTQSYRIIFFGGYYRWFSHYLGIVNMSDKGVKVKSAFASYICKKEYQAKRSFISRVEIFENFASLRSLAKNYNHEIVVVRPFAKAWTREIVFVS